MGEDWRREEVTLGYGGRRENLTGNGHTGKGTSLYMGGLSYHSLDLGMSGTSKKTHSIPSSD